MPLAIIVDVLALANTVYNQAKRPKENAHQCRYIGERIRIAADALSALVEKPTTSTFDLGLQAFETCLREAQQLMGKYNKRGWFKRFAFAKHDEAAFANWHRRFEQAMQQLQLGLQVQQRVDAGAQEQAVLADRQEIAKHYDAIEAQFRQVLLEQQGHRAEAGAQHEQIHAQLLSIKDNLRRFSEPKTRKTSTRSIPYYNLRFEKRLSDGSAGALYLGRWCEQPVVIKRLEGEISKEERLRFEREMRVLSRVSHPHIVTLYGACLEEARQCLVMDYLPGGNVRQQLNKRGLPWLHRLEIAEVVARTMLYLANQGITHRQLRSHNLLLDEHGKVYLTDLGWSKTQAMSLRSLKKQTAGLAWEAPECLTPEPNYTTASDVYSLGMLLWELLTQEVPFSGLSEPQVGKAVLRGERPAIPKDTPPEYARLIQLCWQQDPLQRPSLDELAPALRHYHQKEVAKQETQNDNEAFFTEGREAENRKDFASAVTAYRKAAKLKNVRAAAYIGSLLLRGKPGVPIDKAAAYVFLLQAAQGGHEKGMFNLATQLMKGDGILQDQAQAAHWFQKVANKHGLFQEKAEQALETYQAETAATVRR